MAKPANIWGRFLRGWRDSELGAAPSDSELSVAVALGLRDGSKVAFANGMYLRDCGATSLQVIKAVGGPQLNAMRGMIAAKLVKLDRVPSNDAGHKVYRLTLTAKGAKVVSAAGIDAAPFAAPVKAAPVAAPVDGAA